MKTRSRVLVTIAVLTACAAICAIWSAWLSPVRVGFVNYQTLTLGQISKANDSRFIRIRQLDGDELRRIGGCDFVFINGMGMRITEDERAMIQKAADRGVPMLTTMATNPANDITTVDSLQRATLSAYLSGGEEKLAVRYFRRAVEVDASAAADLREDARLASLLPRILA